jgi:hypothetical protein
VWPYPGYQCGVTAKTPQDYTYPSDNTVIRAHGDMDCLPSPKYISYMEMGVSLLRTLDDQTWQRLNINVVKRCSAGHLPVGGGDEQAQYDCHHRSYYWYTSQVYGYDVADGAGYYGQTERTDYLNCWP